GGIRRGTTPGDRRSLCRGGGRGPFSSLSLHHEYGFRRGRIQAVGFGGALAEAACAARSADPGGGAVRARLAAVISGLGPEHHPRSHAVSFAGSAIPRPCPGSPG